MEPSPDLRGGQGRKLSPEFLPKDLMNGFSCICFRGGFYLSYKIDKCFFSFVLYFDSSMQINPTGKHITFF